MYVDVHTHLTHEKFAADCDAVIKRAMQQGLTAIVVNGLEPLSNRQILKMAQGYPVIKPALGIYPIDAVNAIVKDLPFSVARFDVDEEIKFIRSQAANKSIHAVGECGLDGHWVGEDTFKEQERVFEALIKTAMDFDLPLIIHTRKREERAMEILRHHGAKKVNFHCYGGKVKMALRAAHEDGWWFSIPANARSSESFTKMLRELPEDKILTETDAPYLAPKRGARNEPANVVDTVSYLAELKGWDKKQAAERVWKNYENLFGKQA